MFLSCDSLVPCDGPANVVMMFKTLKPHFKLKMANVQICSQHVYSGVTSRLNHVTLVPEPRKLFSDRCVLSLV